MKIVQITFNIDREDYNKKYSKKNRKNFLYVYKSIYVQITNLELWWVLGKKRLIHHQL